MIEILYAVLATFSICLMGLGTILLGTMLNDKYMEIGATEVMRGILVGLGILIFAVGVFFPEVML